VPHARFTLASAGGEPQTAHCGTPPAAKLPETRRGNASPLAGCHADRGRIAR
jgi:hypothetical protein